MRININIIYLVTTTVTWGSWGAEAKSLGRVGATSPQIMTLNAVAERSWRKHSPLLSNVGKLTQMPLRLHQVQPGTGYINYIFFLNYWKLARILQLLIVTLAIY